MIVNLLSYVGHISASVISVELISKPSEDNFFLPRDGKEGKSKEYEDSGEHGKVSRTIC